MQIVKLTADSPIVLRVLMANSSVTKRSYYWNRRGNLDRGMHKPHQENGPVEIVRIDICSSFVVSNSLDETSRTTISEAMTTHIS